MMQLFTRQTSVFNILLVLIATTHPAVGGAGGQEKDSIISGQVVDAEGKPVENVEVWAVVPIGPIGAGTSTKPCLTNSEGKFELTQDPNWGQRLPVATSLGIVASRDGKQVAGVAVQLNSLPDKLTVKLPTPTEYSVAIENPAREPVTNQEVTVHALRLHNGDSPANAAHTVITLPPELAKRLKAKTNAAGIAKFNITRAEDIAGFTVDSSKHGNQSIVVLGTSSFASPNKIKLRKSGRLRAKLSGPNGISTAGRRITIQTQTFEQQTASLLSGKREVITDETGVFEVVLPVGNVILHCKYSDDDKYRLTSSVQTIQLTANTTVDLDLELKPGARFHGQILENETRKPVSGIPVVVASFASFEFLKADAQGRFETIVAPGTVRFQPMVTSEYMRPNVNPVVQVPPTTEFELDPILLSRAEQLMGTVRDENGRNVAGVAIKAKWGGQRGLSEKQVTSDAEGKFSVLGVEREAEIRLSAVHGEGSALLVHRVDGTPISLELKENSRPDLKSRVVDAAGTSVAGALVEVWMRPWMPTNYGSQAVRWKPETNLATNANGEFIVSAVEADAAYQIRIRDDGIENLNTTWYRADDGQFTFPKELTARRLHVVTGSVVDRGGHGIESARVVYLRGSFRSEVTTDRHGRFSLNGSPGGFLFIRKDGFRFYGERLTSSAGLRTLVRRTEPSSHVLPTQLPPGQVEEGKKLADELFTQLLAQPAKTKAAEQLVAQAFLSYATVNPDETLIQLESGRVSGFQKKGILSKVVVKLAELERIDEALELIEADDDPKFRVQGLMWMTNEIEPAEKNLRLELLSRALIDAKAVKMPGLRAIYFGQIAERLLDQMEVEQATKILREGQEIAEKLSTSAWSGYARGAFAEELAQIDTDAAVDLIRGLTDVSEFNRHLGNMAHELAAKRPDDAIRLLKEFKKEQANAYSAFDQYAVRVCYRMAAVDLNKAERLAAGIGYPENRAYALGVMAAAIKERDTRTAERLMRSAFDILSESIDESFHTASRPYRAGTIAACLLPWVETISPNLVPELFWQAVSFRVAMPEDENQSYWAIESNSSLAIGLSKYDLPLAEKLFAELADAPSKRYSRIYHLVPAFFGPEKFRQHLRSIEDSDQKARVLAKVLPILAADPDDKIRRIHSVLGVWPIDVEDMVW